MVVNEIHSELKWNDCVCSSHIFVKDNYAQYFKRLTTFTLTASSKPNQQKKWKQANDDKTGARRKVAPITEIPSMGTSDKNCAHGNTNEHYKRAFFFHPFSFCHWLRFTQTSCLMIFPRFSNFVCLALLMVRR